MRDIKFRVWKVDKKEMVYPFNWAARVGIIQSNKETTTTMMGSDTAMYTNDPTRCVWMQFTGLKDKNGKEIYEGDIIRYVSCHAGHIGAVSYDTSTASFGVEYMDAEYHYFGKAIYKDSCEVIGNIHENPELLNNE